jgi:hypothetical protein
VRLFADFRSAACGSVIFEQHPAEIGRIGPVEGRIFVARPGGKVIQTLHSLMEKATEISD